MGKQVGSATVSYLESNLESIVSNLPIRMLPESHYLHSGYFGPVRRSWQSDGRDEISGKNLMWPIFVVNGPNQKQSISSLPGVYRMGINTILEQLTELVPLGLTSILLFPVLDDASGAQKDDHGSLALDPVANPVFSAIKAIKAKFGDDLEIACDVCLCTMFHLVSKFKVSLPCSGYQPVENHKNIKKEVKQKTWLNSLRKVKPVV